MFSYNDNLMNDMISSINDNIIEMENMENGYTNKMGSISSSGLYGNGIELVDSQMLSIKNGLTDFKNTTVNNCREIEDLENKLTEDVESIELPKDFDATEVGISIDKEEVSLSKEDGDKVKTGYTDKEELEDNYFEEEENLEDITTNEVERSELEDFKDRDYIDLNEINNNEVEESNLEDYKDTKYVDLNELNDNQLEENILEDYKETSNIDIDELNNNEVEKIIEKELEDFDKVSLKEINDLDIPDNSLEDIYNWGDEDDNKS